MDGDYDRTTGEVIEMDRNNNMRHWLPLSVTDPAHTKPFQRPGGFRGTATRPIWNQLRLTMHFGPVGIGWGTEKPDFQIIPAGDEVLVFCTLKCWYRDNNGERAEVYGVGGDKAVVKRQSGVGSDDEAFKKAYTDALGNAFVKVGVSADIHLGLFENSKYVDWARDQSANRTEEPPEPSAGRSTGRQTQGSGGGAATAAQRPHAPQAAPERTPEQENALTRHNEIRDAINGAMTVPEARAWDGCPAWHAMEKTVRAVEGDPRGQILIDRLRDRIEKRVAMLEEAGGGY